MRLQDQMDQPATSGFVTEAGPPTAEMNEPMSTASGPFSHTTTTKLPTNLGSAHLRPMAPPIGLLLVPIGMPPPPQTKVASAPSAGPAMATHLLGQSILAGLGAAAGPSGFFNVFNPAYLHQPMQSNDDDAADDMELEEADDDVHRHKEQMDGRRWNETPEKR